MVLFQTVSCSSKDVAVFYDFLLDANEIFMQLKVYFVSFFSFTRLSKNSTPHVTRAIVFSFIYILIQLCIIEKWFFSTVTQKIVQTLYHFLLIPIAVFRENCFNFIRSRYIRLESERCTCIYMGIGVIKTSTKCVFHNCDFRNTMFVQPMAIANI